MALQLTCPVCAAAFALPEGTRGSKTFCPKCGESLVITGAGVAKRNEGPNFNLDADSEGDGTGGAKRNEPRRLAPVPSSVPTPTPTAEPAAVRSRNALWLLLLLLLLVLFGGGLAIYLHTRGSTAKEKPVADLKPEPDKFPSIDGVWWENPLYPEQHHIRVNIVQDGGKFTADCSYQHDKDGEIGWRMTGTITKDGKISVSWRNSSA